MHSLRLLFIVNNNKQMGRVRLYFLTTSYNKLYLKIQSVYIIFPYLYICHFTGHQRPELFGGYQYSQFPCQPLASSAT
jgi:hypothetical protein